MSIKYIFKFFFMNIFFLSYTFFKSYAEKYLINISVLPGKNVRDVANDGETCVRKLGKNIGNNKPVTTYLSTKNYTNFKV